MRNTTIGMAVAALILTVLAYYRGEVSLVSRGFIIGGKMLLLVAPLLLVAFLVTGLIQVLVSKEMIAKWLGKESGLKGLFLGGLAGALVLEGPYVSFPIIASIFHACAGIGTAVAFVTGGQCWA